MRIAHVLTYVSTDAAYGGPLSVATGHCQELAARGHEVQLFAGWDGRADLEVPGVRVRLFRTQRVLPSGFAGLVAPRMLVELWRAARDLDVVHVHLARDLVTLTAALMLTLRRHGPRVFVQTHGMIKPDQRLGARLVDVVVRTVLARSCRVFVLFPAEADNLRRVAGDRPVIAELPNGVRSRAPRRPASPGVEPEIVFLARLHPRKRVLLFAEAARMVLQEGAAARFRVVGPDEGDLARLQQFCAEHGLGANVLYEGSTAPGQGAERLRQSDVFVLPSSREPFPMTVLESLSVGVPAVISADCHVADQLVRAGGVVTFDGGAEDLATVLLDLVRDPAQRNRLSQEASASIVSTFGIVAVVDRLEAFYGTMSSVLDDDIAKGRVALQ